MNHASPQPPDSLERCLHIGDREVRQRGRVARIGTTLVNAERGTAGGLPAATFGFAPLSELNAEQADQNPSPRSGSSAGNSIRLNDPSTSQTITAQPAIESVDARSRQHQAGRLGKAERRQRDSATKGQRAMKAIAGCPYDPGDAGFQSPLD